MVTFLDQLVFATRNGSKKHFDFRGKATVSEFWYFYLLFLQAYAVVWLIDHRFLTNVISLKDLPFGNFIPAGYLDRKVGLTLLLYRPIMAAPTFSVTVRQINEVKKRDWWCCLWVL